MARWCVGCLPEHSAKNKLAFGAVRNPAGEFEQATFGSLGAAVDSVSEMPGNFRDCDSRIDAYPIASFPCQLAPSKFTGAAKRDAMKKFLEWIYTAGQKSALSLDYNILSPGTLGKVQAQIDRIE